MRSTNPTPLFWVILSLLAVTENGQTLLSDSLYDELVPVSNSNLEGATAEARGGCHFKESFHGRWFQSGIHHSITITKDAISTKGHCIEKEGEKYLVYSRRDNCYRCLVFNEKHLNVLQYKETFCIRNQKSLREICSTITGDANLYAMFRLDAVPIDCPFKGQFSTSYNRGQGECQYPSSSTDSCTKSSRIVFNYQACPDVPGTESSVEELQCLASWKEGSSRYFLGLISYQHHASYEERFRCFVYERSKGLGLGSRDFGHNPGHNSHTSNKHRSHTLESHNSSSTNPEQIFRVTQSGDATCNGLNTMEGSRTMTLRKVPSTKPCQFPSWIQDHSHWHTLDQGSTYTFLQGNLRISNFSELAGTGPNSLVMNAHCYQHQEVDDFQTSEYLTYGDSVPTLRVMHVTAECKIGFVCAAFHQRHDNIMEIQFGLMARRAEDACQLSHFYPTIQPHVTLVSSAPKRTKCPKVGHFQVTGLSWNGKKVTPESCRQNNMEMNEDDNLSSSGSESVPDSKSESENSTKNTNSLAVGCFSPHQIQIRTKSPCNLMDIFADYSCHGWWSAKDTTYVVTTRSSSSSLRPQRHCFAFRDLSQNGESMFYAEKQRVLSPLDFPQGGNGNGQVEGSGNNSNDNNGNLLEFSSFADSCRRNVALGREGDFAFNLTRMGHCSDINSAPGHHLLYLNVVTTVMIIFSKYW